MGLYLEYQKVSESETEVTYRYGKTPTQLDKLVVISKTDPTGIPRVCQDDRLGPKVISRVNMEQSETSQWPEGGAIQS